MDRTNKWWAYKHVSGTVHAKRYFDEQDITEAQESPFVAVIIHPFDACEHTAYSIALKKLGMDEVSK